jgi:hypothetical protein
MCRTLREDLEDVMVSSDHHVEDSSDELRRNILVEEVAHRIDEDHSRPFPTRRNLEPFRPKPQIETLLVRMAGNVSPPFGEGLRVAVRAAG